MAGAIKGQYILTGHFQLLLQFVQGFFCSSIGYLSDVNTFFYITCNKILLFYDSWNFVVSLYRTYCRMYLFFAPILLIIRINCLSVLNCMYKLQKSIVNDVAYRIKLSMLSIFVIASMIVRMDMMKMIVVSIKANVLIITNNSTFILQLLFAAAMSSL